MTPKEKRLQRRRENEALAKAAGQPVVKAAKKKRKNYRKKAFKRLKDKLKDFVFARAKSRTGGLCEVAVVCGGVDPGVLVYHIFPAKTGNGVKYDHRNLLWACKRCNMGEYGDRCRGTYDRWDKRHQDILGAPLWNQLMALRGRRQILTSEANEMAEKLTPHWVAA